MTLIAVAPEMFWKKHFILQNVGFYWKIMNFLLNSRDISLFDRIGLKWLKCALPWQTTRKAELLNFVIFMLGRSFGYSIRKILNCRKLSKSLFHFLACTCNAAVFNFFSFIPESSSSIEMSYRHVCLATFTRWLYLSSSVQSSASGWSSTVEWKK